MKILHIGKYYYPYYYGGMENHLYNLCEDLCRKEKVEVLVSNVDHRSLSLSLNGIKVEKAGKWMELASTPISPGMVGHLKDKDYDIVHLHQPNPMGNLAYFLRCPGGKMVVTWHSDIVKQKHLSRFYKPLETWVLKRCEKIIVTSQNYLETSVPLQPFRHKCEVIPLGIDIDQFQVTDKIRKESALLRSKYRNIVYFVGRLVYYKGLEYLIRAMQKVEGHLFIASNGPLINTLKKLVRKQRLEKKIFFLGELDFTKLLTFYHACDVFCLPSIDRSEAFGIVQLEAMICGKPVVSTRLDTGVVQVNLHGKTGLVVPPRDPEALARALNCLLKDKPRQKEYGDYARERVRREFNKEIVSDKTLDLYKSVLS